MKEKLRRISIYCAALLSICLLLSNQMVARAEFTQCDRQAVLLNRPYYDPCSVACATAGAPGTVVTLPGVDNPQKVLNFFVGQKGLTPIQGAAIVGNLQQESRGTIDPTARNPSSGAYGIGQWVGGRQDGLNNYAADKKLDPAAIETQLGYLWDVDLPAQIAGGFPELKAFLTPDPTATIESATLLWRKKFERPGEAEAHDDLRIKYAQEALQLYGASAQTGTVNAGSGSVSTACGSGSGGSVVGCNFGAGTGPFANTNTTVYPRVEEMCQRAQKLTDRNSAEFQDACGDSPGTGSNLCAGACESAAEYTWLGTRYQYASAIADWNAQQASGHAHPGDRDPPVGALLFYNTSAFGHVAVYLGNNKLLSTDIDGKGYIYIVNADRMETTGWHAPYLGWSDPYFKGEVQ
ncbi:MAG TPA: phage tail tip lysozyme [Candidatus Saccharimonadales bacterium]|nr:phage tail tip lysozyme [Candidatus Saccharimonadales bacterium]